MIQGAGKYNTYCTNWGCYDGVRRDDIDNGWPTWQQWPAWQQWSAGAGICSATEADRADDCSQLAQPGQPGQKTGTGGAQCTQPAQGPAACNADLSATTSGVAPGSGFVGAPNLSSQGYLRAPPLWHYTVPQSAAAVAAVCGPAGCGPPQIPVWAAFSQQPPLPSLLQQ